MSDLIGPAEFIWKTDLDSPFPTSCNVFDLKILISPPVVLR